MPNQKKRPTPTAANAVSRPTSGPALPDLLRRLADTKLAPTGPTQTGGAMTVAEAGRKGGLIGGKKGGMKVKETRGLGFYQEIGRKGGAKVRQMIKLARANADAEQVAGRLAEVEGVARELFAAWQKDHRCTCKRAGRCLWCRADRLLTPADPDEAPSTPPARAASVPGTAPSPDAGLAAFDRLVAEFRSTLVAGRPATPAPASPPASPSKAAAASIDDDDDIISHESVLRYLKTVPAGLSTTALCEAFEDLPRSYMLRFLRYLQAKGLVKRVGNTRASRWVATGR